MQSEGFIRKDCQISSVFMMLESTWYQSSAVLNRTACKHAYKSGHSDTIKLSFFDNNIQFIDAEDGINGRVYDCNMMRSRKVFAQKVARGATKIHVNHAQQTYTNR